MAQAITLQEAGRLVKVPGIGKKTAERLLLELKGGLGADIGVPTSVANDAQADILQALLALGYSDKEAAVSLKALPADVGVSDGIKLAGSPKLAGEPFKNEIVDSDEILDLAQWMGDAVRHNSRAVSSGLPIAGLQHERVLFPNHRATPDDNEKRARYAA